MHDRIAISLTKQVRKVNNHRSERAQGCRILLIRLSIHDVLCQLHTSPKLHHVIRSRGGNLSKFAHLSREISRPWIA